MSVQVVVPSITGVYVTEMAEMAGPSSWLVQAEAQCLLIAANNSQMCDE